MRSGGPPEGRAGEVVFAGVHKSFGGHVAVRDLSLVIRAGEFMSLLGPSGCGKTTSLRMLAGLEQPTAGRIAIDGRTVNDVPPARRDIAMVFQSYALYPQMTVARNLDYPLRKRGVPRAERARRVQAIAAMLELSQLLDRKPRQLSGGQQQRVALGRALVRDPAVFLLDEPLSNLDAKLRSAMRAELILLHRRIGRTVVYVTHDQLEAMTMSDRIAVMQGGVLQQCGPPDAIYNRPANLFVAGFIGTPAMNLLQGELAGDPGGPIFRAGRLELRLQAGAVPRSSAAGEPTRATLGIRPEDVLPAGEGEPATIRLVEPTGHEQIVTYEVAGHRLVGRVGPERRLLSGETIRLQWRSPRLHLFAADGRRMDGGAGELAWQDRVAVPDERRRA